MPECPTLFPAVSYRRRHQQPQERCRRQMSLTRILRGVRDCDVTVDEGSAAAMLITAATGFSACIQARDRLALHVDDLSPPVDAKTTVRIVPDGVECCGVEWRLLDLIHRRIGSASELRIASFIHVRIPLRYCFLQV